MKSLREIVNKLLHKGSKVIQYNTAQDNELVPRKLGDKLGDNQMKHPRQRTWTQENDYLNFPFAYLRLCGKKIFL